MNRCEHGEKKAKTRTYSGEKQWEKKMGIHLMKKYKKEHY